MKDIFRYDKPIDQLLFKTRVDWHTGGTWLIHGTKHKKNNRTSLLYVEYPSWEYKFDIKDSGGNIFIPIS